MKRGLIRTLFLLVTSAGFALLSLTSLHVTWASFQSVPPSSFLRVQGPGIVNGNGQPIYLRGINMHTYYYLYRWDPNAPWTYATEEDIQYLAALGINAIRLAFHWRYFQTALGFDLIDTYLSWCERAGIYVILDLHVVPPDEDILQGRIWDDPVAQERFLDLWAAIAARYAQRTIVAGYDLYNEPAPPDPAQWWELAERTRARIRAVDANHMLFVEAPLSAEGVGLQVIEDPNVVYSYHEYSPIVVSHAGADWLGDSPVPTSYAYPGRVLQDVRWIASANEGAEFTGRSSAWIPWDSGALAVPSGAEFADITPFAWGDVGEVWFDDIELLHNGSPKTVFNAGMEEESQIRGAMPAHWSFWSDSGFGGSWSAEAAHRGARSLKIASDGSGYGQWYQSNWIMTAPLLSVQPGDTLHVRGWLRAPTNNGGGAGLGVNYLQGVYEHYDRARLQANLQPYLDWAAAHNVPLFVGEFGVMSSAPGDSRYHWTSDLIALMNEAGLHWTLWAYRDGDPPSFGLYLGEDLDERLAQILRLGLRESELHSTEER